MPEVAIQCFPDCFDGPAGPIKAVSAPKQELAERRRRGGIPQPLEAWDFPGGLGSSAAFAGCPRATAEHRAPPAGSERWGARRSKRAKGSARLRRDGERHKILFGLCSPLR